MEHERDDAPMRWPGSALPDADAVARDIAKRKARMEADWQTMLRRQRDARRAADWAGWRDYRRSTQGDDDPGEPQRPAD